MALYEELDTQGNYLFRRRGILPVILLIAGIIAAYYTGHQFLHQERLYVELMELSAIPISVLGILIRIYTVGHVPAETSGRNRDQQRADRLNTTGIYSVVRHPLYLGNFLIWLGVALYTQSLWFVLLFVPCFWLYYERIMFAEENYLKNKFGNHYLVWARKTPTFFPNFKMFERNQRPFNWKKVLVQERSGVLALSSVLFLFESLFDYLDFGRFYPDDPWIIYLYIGWIILYFFLRQYGKKVDLNDESKPA